MFVDYRYRLAEDVKRELKKKTPEFGFNGFGKATYYRTYSRLKEDGSQEDWADTVIRVIEGIMSIRIDWLQKMRMEVDFVKMNSIAAKLAFAMFDMHWLPSGRGLWAMGTDYTYERGAMALYNCASVEVTQPSKDFSWAMDVLMCGVGVGFGIFEENEIGFMSPEEPAEVYRIPDSREGWVESVRRLLASYEDGSNIVEFDYSKIRPFGSPIKGFGGVASGPDPLCELHERLRLYCDRFTFHSRYSWTRFVADCANAIGCCVVAGNVRRSAEILIGKVSDPDFLSLKDYDAVSDIVSHKGENYRCKQYHYSTANTEPGSKNGERFWEPSDLPTDDDWEQGHFWDGRSEIGWMSNNTVRLEQKTDFLELDLVSNLIKLNGEPGICNLINMQEFGRYGTKMDDPGSLLNPCAEIVLESYETCNLAEVFPPRCSSKKEIYDAMEYATFYASTVALLPTHRPETNRVIAKNRRIGVSISGIADWVDEYNMASVIPMLRKGYKIVRRVNAELAQEAGVPPSIRVTTVKPSGSISTLAGVSSGINFPTFQYAIRRIRVGEGSPIVPILIKSGVPYEEDVNSRHTLVFEFPIDQGKTRPSTKVSMWEQLSLVAALQREWADNSVSVTVYYDPETEGHQIEHALAQFAPLVKSVSLLPHTENGAYQQMPYEGISHEEYLKRVNELGHVDWTEFSGSDGIDERFCNNGTCSL